MISDTPIRDFLYRTQTWHIHDFAMLMFCVAIEEAGTWPISPVIATGKMFRFDGVTEAEMAASFARLVASGEIEKVETDAVRGYQVVRFDEFQDAMTDFGKRRYNRLVQRKRRKVSA